MHLPNLQRPLTKIALITLAAVMAVVLLRPGKIQAQRPPAPALAQVGPGSPLPVYVVNDQPPALPDGFVPGSSWKFTSWTTPSTISFVATVQKTEGSWAALALSTDPQTSAKWYYIPQMPGAWELQ